MKEKYKVWISRVLHSLFLIIFFTVIHFFEIDTFLKIRIIVVIATVFSFHSYELRLIKKELHNVSTELDEALNKAGVISLSISRNKRLIERLNIFDFIDAIKSKIKNLR